MENTIKKLAEKGVLIELQETFVNFYQHYRIVINGQCYSDSMSSKDIKLLLTGMEIVFAIQSGEWDL